MTPPPEEDPSFPLREHLGLEIIHGEGTATATVDLDGSHMNPHAIAHGAVAFTLMDTAMGAAVVSVIEDGNLCATIEIHTRFHRPVTEGRLTATATVLSAGRRVVHLQARTVVDDDRLVASATGSFAVIPAPA